MNGTVADGQFKIGHYTVNNSISYLPSVSLISMTCLIIFNGINLICLYDLAPPFNLCVPEFGSFGLFPLNDFLFLHTYKITIFIL